MSILVNWITWHCKVHCCGVLRFLGKIWLVYRPLHSSGSSMIREILPSWSICTIPHIRTGPTIRRWTQWPRTRRLTHILRWMSLLWNGRWITSFWKGIKEIPYGLENNPCIELKKEIGRGQWGCCWRSSKLFQKPPEGSFDRKSWQVANWEASHHIAWLNDYKSMP